MDLRYETYQTLVDSLYKIAIFELCPIWEAGGMYEITYRNMGGESTSPPISLYVISSLSYV